VLIELLMCVCVTADVAVLVTQPVWRRAVCLQSRLVGLCHSTGTTACCTQDSDWFQQRAHLSAGLQPFHCSL